MKFLPFLTAILALIAILKEHKTFTPQKEPFDPFTMILAAGIVVTAFITYNGQLDSEKDAALYKAKFEALQKQGEDIRSEITGGDSYVQVKYLPLENVPDQTYPNGRRFEIDFTLYNKFNYPVSDIRGQLTEFDSTGKTVKVDSFIIGEALNPSADTSNSQALYLSASNAVHFPKRIIATHEKELYFEFNIVQRNREEITQQIILKKVAADNDMSPKYARIWVAAHRVYSKKQKKFVDEWSDKPFFPTGSDGKVDWSLFRGIP